MKFKVTFASIFSSPITVANMDLLTFLVHFGYEVGVLKQKGIDFADINHDEDSIWLTVGDQIDISDITNFGFFTTKLIDEGKRLFEELPDVFKIFHLNIEVICQLHPEPNEPSPEMITQIMHRGLPCPLKVITDDGDASTLMLADLVLGPPELIDAILGLQRLMPSMLAEKFPQGIPCRVVKKISDPSNN